MCTFGLSVRRRRCPVEEMKKKQKMEAFEKYQNNVQKNLKKRGKEKKHTQFFFFKNEK